MNVKLTLSERIQDEMNKKGLSNSDLCKKANIPPNTLSQFLSGQVENPKAHNLIKLSKGLNVSIDYLLGLQDDPTTNVDLQTISNEYGISSKAMENIKNIYKFKDEYVEGVCVDLMNNTNIFLESEMFKDFIYSWESYFEYSSLDFDKFEIRDNSSKKTNQFEVSAYQMEEILLNNVKECIKRIKFNYNHDSADILEKIFGKDIVKHIRQIQNYSE